MKTQFFLPLGRYSVLILGLLGFLGSPLQASAAPCTTGTLPTGPTAFAATAPNLVSVLDASANTVVCTFAVGSTLTSSPTNLVVSPDGSTVYVENDGEASISVINLATAAVSTISLTTSGVTAPMTANLAISPDGTFLYVASLPQTVVPGTTTPTLSVITIPALTVTSTTSLLSTPVTAPGLGVAFVPEFAGVASEAYIATEGQTYELTGNSTAATVSTIAVNGGTIAIVPNPLNLLSNFAFVVDDAPAANTIYEFTVGQTTFSTITPTAVSPSAVCSQADTVTITPDSAVALYTCPGNDFVQAISAASNTVEATVTLTSLPQGIAITPDGASAYTANADGTLSVIPIATIASSPTVTTIAGSSALAGIAFRPVQLSVTPSGQSVPTGTTSQFTANILYEYPLTSTITWSVSCTAGGAACGTITTTGLYTAPQAIPTPNDVQVIAASNQIPRGSVLYPAQSASTAITITPSKLAFTVEPVNGTAGTALTTFTVSVEDAMGNVDTSISTGSVSLTSTGAITSGTTSEPIVAGVATFSDIVFDTATVTGYTFTASSAGLTSANSSSFTIAPGTATQLLFTTQPANGTAGVALASFAVSVEDAFNNVVTSSTASITLTSTGAISSGTNPVTAVAGVATFNNIVFDTATATGYTVTATSTVPPLTSLASNSFTIAPAAASKLVFTTQPPASGTAGVALTSFVVKVEDAFNNVVTSSTASITLTSTGVISSGTNPVTAVAGVATFNNIVFNTATATGYTVTATSTVPPLTSLASSSFTIAPAAASKLVFTTQPANSTAGVALTSFVVKVEDDFNNVVTSSAASITLTSTGAISSGTNPVTAVAGVATFNNIVFDTATATGYTVTATSTVPPLTSLASNSFTIAPAAASKLAFTTQPVNGTAGTALTSFAVSVEDTFNNVVTSSTAPVTLTSTGVISSGTNPVTAVAGVATFNNIVFNTATATGYTVTATSTGPTLTSPASSSFAIVPGIATQLLFTTQPVGGALGGNVTPLPAVAITVEDAFNNLATNSAASITISSTPANVSGTVTLTPTNGVATFGNLQFTKTGTYTLKATSTGPTLTSLASTAFTLTSTIAVNTSGTLAAVKIEDAAGADKFVAAVTNDPNNPTAGVTWVMTTCGTSTTVLAPCGTVAANGAYTPPLIVPNPTPTFVILATSVADGTKSGTQTVTISSSITVTVTPATAANITLAIRVGTQTFTAPPQNDPGNGGVTWSVNGTVGGSATLGTISAAGVYNAPTVASALSSVTVTATAVDDTTKSNSSVVTILTSQGSVAAGSPPTILISATASSGGTTINLVGPAPADNTTFTPACTGFGTLTGASCAFTPPTTTGTASGTTSIGITLNVTRSVVMPSDRMQPFGRGPLADLVNWKMPSLLLGLGFLGLLTFRLLLLTTPGTRRGFAFVLLLCLTAGGMTACAQFSTPGTPSTPVSPTVTATGNLTVTITPSGTGAANFKTITVLVPFNVQ